MANIKVSSLTQLNASLATFTYGINNAGGDGKVALGAVNGLPIFDASGNILSTTSSIIITAASGSNSGDITLAAVGATPNANGASLSGQVFTLQPADGTHPGITTTAAQTWAGVKTFTSAISVLSGDSSTYSIQSSGTNLTIFASSNIFFVHSSGTYGVTINNGSSTLELHSYQLGFCPGNSASDTGFGRTSAGLLEVNNNTIGQYRDLTVRARNIGAAESAAASNTKKSVSKTAIANATATSVFTITIPNAAHSASIKVRLAGSLGAGGAIGANEATGTIAYDIAVARTAGVNAVAGISTAYGSSTAAVAGAATITVTAALAAVVGAVGASNTIDIQVTITRGSGSSTNHTCVATAEIINANATGISIA
jgi:hypothetical protein